MIGRQEDLTEEAWAKVRQAKASTSQHEKAVLEAEIWATVKKELREKGGIGKTLAPVVGDTEYAIQLRMTLLRSGLEDIWKRVDLGMPLRVATDMVKDAKRRALNLRRDPREVLRELLAEMDREAEEGRSYKVVQGDRVFFRKKTKRLPPEDPGTPRGFGAEVRRALKSYLEAKTKSLSEAQKISLIRDFEVDLKVLIDQWQKRVYRENQIGSTDLGMPERRKVVEWCRALKMDPPKKGEPVDEEALRDRRRKLGRAYHPDSHGGKKDTVTLYIQVTEAYDNLMEYNARLRGNDGQEEE